MTSGAVTPDEQTFLALARHRRVVPVTRRLLADAETPVGVYRKLAGGPGTFLLESAEHGLGAAGAVWSRYSFIGVRSAATLIEADGVAHWQGEPPAGVPRTGDPVEVLRATIDALTYGSSDGEWPCVDSDPWSSSSPCARSAWLHSAELPPANTASPPTSSAAPPPRRA